MDFADFGEMFLLKNMAYELIVLEKRKWKTIKKETKKNILKSFYSIKRLMFMNKDLFKIIDCA